MADASDLVRVDGDDVIVAVHVQPRAGRTTVVGRHGESLKVRVAAPPVDDRANAATVELLADILGVPAGDVEIVTGGRSRLKRARVRAAVPSEVVEALERALDRAAEPPGPRQRRGR